MAKNYYKILGLEKDATQEEIKKAYRKMAHRYHPDKNGGDEQRFKEINEAYQVLGDTQKRQQYDQFGSSFGGAGGGWDFSQFARGAQGFQGNIDLEDLFGNIFSNFSGGRHSQPRGRDIAIDIHLTLEEAFHGAVKDIELKKYVTCTHCNGDGAEPDTALVSCDECAGTGEMRSTRRTMFGAFSQVRMCETCGGAGQRPEKPCTECGGEGRVRTIERLSIPIPSGVADGNSVVINQKGEAAPRGGQPGNLIARIHTKKHETLTRKEDDLYSTLTISFPQAVFGDTVTTQTIEGEEEVSITKGTQSGSQITLKGKGMPRSTGSSSSARGNQYITMQVETPKKLSRKAKKLLKELDEELE